MRRSPSGDPALTRRAVLRAGLGAATGALALPLTACRRARDTVPPAADLAAPGLPRDGRDPLVRQVRGELREFTTWLRRHRVRGYIGEVGWPGRPADDADSWTRLAEQWYRDADAASLWVTNWAAGDWWGDYRLATYRASRPQGTLDMAGPQARVVETHPSTDRYRRGVAVAGGAFGAPSDDATSAFSNASPGTIERDYHFDGPQSMRWLRSRGVDLARIEFRWERIQPRLGAGLRTDELRRLEDIVDAAGEAGLSVVLDLHNYGGYYAAAGGRGVRLAVGSAALPAAALTDVWLRVADAFAQSPTVTMLGLMNEPVVPGAADDRRTAGRWEDVSRAVVGALRKAGERRTISVPGAFWSRLRGFTARHPSPWVEESNVVYEAHHYWDLLHDSTYRLSYRRQRARGA